MHAIKSARQLIDADRTSKNAKILSNWILAVQAKDEFDVACLYELDVDSFDIALAILEEWWIDDYYIDKAKLFDVAFQVSKISIN